MKEIIKEGLHFFAINFVYENSIIINPLKSFILLIKVCETPQKVRESIHLDPLKYNLIVHPRKSMGCKRICH